MNLLRQTSIYICALSLLGVAACTTNNPKKQPVFDFNNLGRIELQIKTNDASTPLEPIIQETSKNLAEWHYPVGAKDNEAFSHILKASVGSIEYGDTPSGFSFSSGNSDPRAMGFQKTFVLPITCQLTAISHPEQTSELKLGFSTDESGKVFLATDNLADHISTVCFNLLTELKWPLKPEQDANKSTVETPSWIPEIRIETKEAPITPINKATPDTNGIGGGIETKTLAPTNSEHRKQIIIYNQGSPLILELGHERR
jgi:hypothetical protein